MLSRRLIFAPFLRSHRVEQNVGIIAVSVPAIRPLISRIFQVRGFGSHEMSTRYGRAPDFGMELGNMTGKSKGAVSHRATTTVTASRKDHFDDNGSESSLVKGVSSDRILKRVSVELHVGDRASEEPASSSNTVTERETQGGTWFKV